MQEIIERLSQCTRDWDLDGGNVAYLSFGKARCVSRDGLWDPQGISADVRKVTSRKADHADMLPKTEADATAGGSLEAVALGG